jgi:hypothetical protein
MLDVNQDTISQPSNKTFPRRNVSEADYAEASAGAHQRLIRDSDGRFFLIVRHAVGIIERRTVHVFEGSVLA